MAKKPYCPKCEKQGVRIDQFDAYACRECNLWLEEGCNASDCDYCIDRPITPEKVEWEDPNNG